MKSINVLFHTQEPEGDREREQPQLPDESTELNERQLSAEDSSVYQKQ